MKKQIIITLATAAGILALGGCNKETGFAEAGGDITIEASVGAMTKVSYEDESKNKSSFTAGDQIAVYGWRGSTAAVPATRLVDGVVNTLGTDGKWTPASQMLWKPGKDAHYFLGVYPVHAITSFTADAYTLNPANYTASDLLIATNLDGVKASQGPVALTFDHAMAKLVVNLKFRSEFGGTPAVSSVTVSAKSTATVDYLTKAVTATGDAAAVVIPAAATVPTGYALSFSGLQVPQEGVKKVTVTIGGKEYVYESATDIPLVRGQYTTLGLVVGKDKIELNSVSVSDWTAGAGLPGGEAEYIIPVTASNYLTFTSEGTTTISLDNKGGNAPKLYYSTDAHNWTEWDYSELTFTSSAPLYICGDNPGGFSDAGAYSQFVDSGSNYSVSGDIMSLLDKDNEVLEIPKQYCFYYLFQNCRLTEAPALPATTLVYGCYEYMFAGCASLQTAPELPATTLEEFCYKAMFQGCDNLQKVPVLPAAELVHGCYENMFSNCFNLNYVKCLATDIKAEFCTYFWMGGTTSSGTFVKAAGMNDWPRGEDGIPDDWTIINAD